MIRAACVVVVLAPLGWFSVQWFDKEAKVKECAIRAYNLDNFGAKPGDGFYFEVPPGAKSGTASIERYKKALRKCKKTVS